MEGHRRNTVRRKHCDLERLVLRGELKYLWTDVRIFARSVMQKQGQEFNSVTTFRLGQVKNTYTASIRNSTLLVDSMKVLIISAGAIRFSTCRVRACKHKGHCSKYDAI